MTKVTRRICANPVRLLRRASRGWPLAGTDNQVPQQLCIHRSLGGRIMCESRVSQSREGDNYGKGYLGTC